jgi:glycosidase
MTGKKPDQYIREPFLWDTKENDKARAHWISPRYSTDSSLVAEKQQEKDPASMFNYYKTFIALRNNSKALTFGEMEPVDLNSREICSFIRTYEDESLLVIHNLSKAVIDVNLPEALTGYNKVLFKNKNAGLSNKAVQLSPYSTLILKK